MRLLIQRSFLPERRLHTGLSLWLFAVILHALEIAPMAQGRDAYMISRATFWHQLLLWLTRIAWAVSVWTIASGVWLHVKKDKPVAAPSEDSVIAAWRGVSAVERVVLWAAMGFSLLHMLHVIANAIRWIATPYDLLGFDLTCSPWAVTYVLGITVVCAAGRWLALTLLERGTKDWPEAKQHAMRWIVIALCVLVWTLFLNVVTLFAAGQSLF